MIRFSGQNLLKSLAATLFVALLATSAFIATPSADAGLVSVSGPRLTQSSGGGGGGGTILFNPGDLGAYTTPQQVFTVDVNNHDGGSTALVSSSGMVSPFGSTKIMRVAYPSDEAGTQWQFPAFSPTTTLYYRWYMYLDANWSGKYPVGLKTTRSFTRSDYTATVGDSGTQGDAYTGPKFIWMKYADASGFAPGGIGGDPNGTSVWGVCIATMNVDVGAAYASPIAYAGTWRLLEVYQTMNSADGVHDGTLELRVDKTTVFSSSTMDWVNSGPPHYTHFGIAGWQSMWFGGNYSAGDFPGRTTLSPTLYRYEDGFFVSTDARWVP